MGEISKTVASELGSIAKGIGDVIFGDGYIKDSHHSKDSSKNSKDDDYYDDDYQYLDDDDD